MFGVKKKEEPDVGEQDGSSSKATVSLHASVERFYKPSAPCGSATHSTAAATTSSNKLLLKRLYCTFSQVVV